MKQNFLKWKRGFVPDLVERLLSVNSDSPNSYSNGLVDHVVQV